MGEITEASITRWEGYVNCPDCIEEGRGRGAAMALIMGETKVGEKTLYWVFHMVDARRNRPRPYIPRDKFGEFKTLDVRHGSGMLFTCRRGHSFGLDPDELRGYVNRLEDAVRGGHSGHKVRASNQIENKPTG